MKKFKSVWTGNVYGEEALVETAPKTEGTLEFFKIDKIISAQELQNEYDKRGLIPAHPLVLAKWAEKNLKIGDWYATQWDGDGWCYATFDRWLGERHVYVLRGDVGWGGRWSFAGVRKSSALEPSEKPLDTLPSNLESRIEKLEAFEAKVRKFLII